MLTWRHGATRKFRATFAAICTAVCTPLLAFGFIFAGSANPQVIRYVSYTQPDYQTIPALTWQQNHVLHLKHLAHLAHLKRLAALAAAAEERQKLAAMPATAAAGTQLASQHVISYQGSTSMQQCIISRESGGNPYIWNASGHWGLYQFSASTWSAHGGAPADFGKAGPAEQTAVFWQTVHDDGYSDWSPYDGC